MRRLACEMSLRPAFFRKPGWPRPARPPSGRSRLPPHPPISRQPLDHGHQPARTGHRKRDSFRNEARRLSPSVSAFSRSASAFACMRAGISSDRSSSRSSAMGPRQQEFRVGHGIDAPAPGSRVQPLPPSPARGRGVGGEGLQPRLKPRTSLPPPSAAPSPGGSPARCPHSRGNSNPLAVSVTCISSWRLRSVFS